MMSFMRALVQALVALGVGLKSSDSESERGSSIVFVDWMFLFFLRGVPCWWLVTFIDISDEVCGESWPG